MRIIEKQCPMCNKHNTLEVDSDQYRKWKEGTLIQDAFPTMPVEDREFLITGYCKECQVILFAPPEED